MVPVNQLSPEAEASLEVALEGKPPEVKARVRKVVLERGIHPTDPLWEIVIALDILLVLIEESPQSWQQVFAEFQNRLELWTSQNLNILQALQDEAEGLERLARGSEQLGVTVEELTATCQNLVSQLERDRQVLESLVGNWRQLKGAALPQIGELQASVQKQSQEISRLTKAIKELQRGMGKPAFLQQTSWKGTVVAAAAIYAVLFSGVSLVTLTLYLKDRPLLVEMYEQTEWLRE